MKKISTWVKRERKFPAVATHKQIWIETKKKSRKGNEYVSFKPKVVSI